MGVGYKPVLWNRQKKRYDLFIALGIVLYLVVFAVVTITTNPFVRPETIVIRGTASLAFIMLHIILAIGPLARLNNKYLPLLYNRRHLGVSMFMIAAVHSVFSIIQFHALGDANPIVSIFTANAHYDALSRFPFQPLGFLAFLILFLMAATSHDFWLKNLSPGVWKSLHMLVYVAYVLLLGHVVFGILQYESFPLRYALVIGGAVTLVVLHVAAARKEKAHRRTLPLRSDSFQRVCGLDEIPKDRAAIVQCGDQDIAIFRYDGKLSAVHNLCKHQNGPLGEGKIVDGCITCPWHGYQYLPENGTSPAPFNEKVKTYRVRIEGRDVLVDPNPLEEGTSVEPAKIES